jgi:hypothetical protein
MSCWLAEMRKHVYLQAQTQQTLKVGADCGQGYDNAPDNDVDGGELCAGKTLQANDHWVRSEKVAKVWMMWSEGHFCDFGLVGDVATRHTHTLDGRG